MDNDPGNVVIDMMNDLPAWIGQEKRENDPFSLFAQGVLILILYKLTCANDLAFIIGQYQHIGSSAQFFHEYLIRLFVPLTVYFFWNTLAPLLS